MKELQVHQAFAKWLDHEKIPFVHSRTDKRHTNALGDCDFYCFLAGRVLGVEFKVGRNKLSKVQEKRIAYLRQAGNTVEIAYSCEEAILAISEHFRIVNADSGAHSAENGRPETDLSGGNTLKPRCGVGLEDAKARPSGTAERQSLSSPAAQNLFIGNIGLTDYVLYGDSRPGGLATIVRTATADDLRTIPKKDWR